ncbi:MAG: sugar phosphate isomerase/epimerase family protein [Celeribacter sp.]
MNTVKLSVITDGLSADLEQALTVAAEFDLQAVEIQHLAGNQIHMLSSAEVAHARRLLADFEMPLCCVTGHAFHGHAISDVYSDQALLSAELDKLKACLDFAAACDCRTVRLMNFRKEMFLFGGGGAEFWNVNTALWDQLLDMFQKASALASDTTLVVETGLNSAISSAALGRKMIDALATPNIEILWDPANCLFYSEQPVPDGIDALGIANIGHVHIKDMHLDIPGAEIQHCAIGHGNMGPYLEPLAQSLRDGGYDGYVSLESVYRPEGGTFEDGFRASMDNFRRHFGSRGS